jgi:hypothetical protein
VLLRIFAAAAASVYSELEPKPHNNACAQILALLLF